ncbi:MAG: hypothetical protein JO360_18625, partial [Acidobacteria bacterium]|nr:hypothetical protein [Acidobacteriota bacterium]
QQLVLTVTQTQRTVGDTPAAFRLPVAVEILTPSGWHTERIEINQRTQSFNIKLDGTPRSVIFDRNISLLKKIDFQPPREAQAYRIVDGADMLARASAGSQPVLTARAGLSAALQTGFWSWASVGRTAEKSVR